MPTPIQPLPPVPHPAAEGESFFIALFLALALHALVILGVSFNLPEPDKSKSAPMLDITLVQRPSTVTPEDADYLAETSQQGTGNTRERTDPTPPQRETASVSPPPAPKPPAPQTLTAKDAEAPPEPSPQEPGPEQPAPVTAADLVRKSLEMVQLDETEPEEQRIYAQHERHTFISARTKAFSAAAYMRAWVKKVERVGNLNYPDEARRRGLSGHLQLDVSLEPDGSVRSIVVIRSSGQKILDDAAVRIVRLAAPFAPFPPEIREKTDVLHITRTWEFINNNRLRGR